MKSDGYTIRSIRPVDNAEMGLIVREVLVGAGAPCEGTAFADPSLNAMFETYNQPHSRYWVVQGPNKIWGGAGIAPLEGGSSDTCELQKMYFRKEIRGLGLGKAMIKLALDTAREMGYKKCYLETMPYMEVALSLYNKHGFKLLDQPMGCTGHTACQIWMVKDLS